MPVQLQGGQVFPGAFSPHPVGHTGNSRLTGCRGRGARGVAPELLRLFTAPPDWGRLVFRAVRAFAALRGVATAKTKEAEWGQIL